MRQAGIWQHFRGVGLEAQRPRTAWQQREAVVVKPPTLLLDFDEEGGRICPSAVSVACPLAGRSLTTRSSTFSPAAS